MRPDLTVARLLTRAFAVLLVLIVVSGTSGAAAVILQHQTVKELTDHVLPLQLANAHLRSVLSAGQRGLRGYLLTGDPSMLDTYRLARSQYFVAAQSMRQLAVPSETRAIDVQVARADVWWTFAERQRLAPPRSDEAVRYVTEGRPLFLSFESENTTLDLSLGSQADRLRAESVTLGVVTTTGLVVLTVAASLVAVLTGVRTTRRITTPLRALVAVLDRLRGGDHGSRAAADQGPAEIRAVASAVNTMADEAARIRDQDDETSRLGREVRALNTRVRQHLSVETAMQEAATGLAATLAADHALVRMAARNSADRMVASCSTATAAGTLEPLAQVDTAWLKSGDIWVVTDPAELPETVPQTEARAWLDAGAGPMVTVTVSNGDEPLGAVTLLRAPGGAPWSPVEARLVESVAADLGRGVHQARLYEQEQHLVAQLKELDTAKTDFMSTVSHELRTPLTSIAGYVEMLRDEDAGAVSPAQAKMLDVIGRNTVRLRTLIEDLLILSRIEGGTLRTRRKTVDLAVVVGSALTAAGASAEKGSVTVRSEIDGPLPVLVDVDQLDRVVLNLLSNAVKFSPPGGEVSVSGRIEDGEVVLVIGDSGMGIPEPEQQRLFERFFRASNAIHHAIPGTGLGLAIAQTILANHDGSIGILSAEGVGTTVTARLPVAEQPVTTA